MNRDFSGLTSTEVNKRREMYGYNTLEEGKKESFFSKIIHTVCEPMFLLLMIASIIYFILGEPRDGAIMLIFVVGIITIDIVQEWKTDKTLEALRDLSEPKVLVIRDNKKQEIASKELVCGDIMLIYEGVKVPADGKVLKCSGLSIDESSLTGESVKVFKEVYSNIDTNEYFRKDYCYAGTLVVQGTGTIEVTSIGNKTEYGKIGSNLVNIKESKTPLQSETDSLVKVCALIAFVLFILVGIITFFNLTDHTLKDRIIESILSGVTLAMAMIPEEFPVVLTVFLSMGAWRLARNNALVKRLAKVETLGQINVLCVDKTGTLTKNQMEVVEKYEIDLEMVETMGLCCMEDTFDPMEKAMLKYCKKNNITKKHLFGGEKIKEYPFSNESKIMGMLWNHEDILLLSVKGSPESIISLCDNVDIDKVNKEIDNMSSRGLRVIAVAKKILKNKSEIKDELIDYRLDFSGLVGLIDPPRDNIKEDIETCTKAGIRVIMITGDNGLTASSIASMIGLSNHDDVITGNMIDQMSDEELRKKVMYVSIFSRVTPEHKMRIVSCLKDNGLVVAMTGDGVNDAIALKKSSIGIAMGKRGSEVAREASSLILMDDNFSTIVNTIKDGRRIYDNIKKAVNYIFIIHIPIALSSLVAPLLAINPKDLLLLPLHVVILELVIDPTCSIVLERIPAESNIMDKQPRSINSKLVTFKSVLLSIIEGIILFLASFGTYYYFINQSVLLARTMGLVIIILGNIFLVQVNSSNYDYAYKNIINLAKDKLLLLINLVAILLLLVILYTPLNSILKLYPLTFEHLLIALLIAFISVFWVEIIKVFKHIKKTK